MFGTLNWTEIKNELDYSGILSLPFFWRAETKTE
jgi:hypothetical protein